MIHILLLILLHPYLLTQLSRRGKILSLIRNMFLNTCVKSSVEENSSLMKEITMNQHQRTDNHHT